MEDLFSLRGKVAIVTGGNGGIGKGIADGLASAGSDIVVAARNETKTDEAVRDIKEKFGVRALGLMVDVRQEESIQAGVKQVLDEFGKINILVNNAGINIRHMPQDYAVAEWDEVMEINLRGAFLCAKAVYPAMKQAGGGKIISIGSMTSLFGLAKVAPYACSKMGIVSLTYTLSLAWAKDNIQVNAILPGWIDTPLSVSARRDFPGLDEFICHRTPAGRWGTPTDFAGAAVFLASRASDFITGEYLKVDGGFAQGTITVSPAGD
ncbi:MAG TPA: glucose 1-dehydrogenase [Dehalococcoidales bacterium]|nr:glucose 1-dehydrogenase [Dehalococcoidales bacterium]